MADVDLDWDHLDLLDCDTQIVNCEDADAEFNKVDGKEVGGVLETDGGDASVSTGTAGATTTSGSNAAGESVEENVNASATSNPEDDEKDSVTPPLPVLACTSATSVSSPTPMPTLTAVAQTEIETSSITTATDTETTKDGPDPSKENSGEKSDNENEDGIECGFLVDKISTIPYQKAIERGEVPFCAFAPISTKDLYILRIQECSDTTRHMLVPATKEEVFNTRGALKMLEQEPGNDESLNHRVAIVAIARQLYSEEDKQLVVSVDPLLKRDQKKITVVKFLTLEKFADFAFLGFDGNISEFVNKTESESKENNSARRTSSSSHHHHSHIKQSKTQSSSNNAENLFCPPPPVPTKQTGHRGTSRRGRGGRRRGSRKSPSSATQPYHLERNGHPSSQTSQSHAQHFAGNFQHLPPGHFHHQIPNDQQQQTITFVKLDSNGQAQQYYMQQVPITQFQDGVGLGYVQDPFGGIPVHLPSVMTSTSSEIQVPMPMNEVTICTAEANPPEAGNQQPNQDIITIAFDQLVNMTRDSFNSNAPPEIPQVGRGTSSGRGGRRPGRKPGRKPALKEKAPQPEIDENTTFGQLLNSGNETLPVPGPKRRGRPPKNQKLLKQLPSVVTGQENETTGDCEDFEEKLMKLQIPSTTTDVIL